MALGFSLSSYSILDGNNVHVLLMQMFKNILKMEFVLNTNFIPNSGKLATLWEC